MATVFRCKTDYATRAPIQVPTLSLTKSRARAYKGSDFTVRQMNAWELVCRLRRPLTLPDLA